MKKSELEAELAEIRSARDRLSGIINNNTEDAIICVNEDQGITLFNGGAERVFGYTASEAIGQSLKLLLPLRTAEAHRGYVGEFAASADQSRRMGERSAVWARRKDGSEFQAEVSISKHAMPDGLTFTAVLRDISERVRADGLLQEKEQRLRLALAAGHMGTFQIDERDGAAQLDAAALELLGLSAAKLVSDLFRNLHPDDIATIQALQAAGRTRGGEVHAEFRVLRPDGSVSWLSAHAHFELDEGGKTHRTTGVLADVTERKQVEEQLESRVAERTRELQAEMKRREEMQAALAEAQRLEAIGKLVGGVAHDSNNLLTVIGGNLEMLEEALGPEHAGLKFLREAQSAVERKATLNRRLLTVAGRRKLEARVLGINDQVKTMSEMLRRVLGEPITLATTLHADLWKVKLDASELDNALLNLAINARDAMPRGGRLHISTKNVAIDEDATRGESDLAPGRYVSISVTDSGEGIAPEILPRVFEPFFTTKAQGKGTGLGLATVHGFTKQSGGHVTIYSEPGRGTTVNIYFPRHEGAEAAEGEQRSRQMEAANGRGETILVVEDDAQVRAITSARLERLNYRVLEAPDGPSALALLQRGERVDLVFSDIAMPGGMSGFDLMGALEQRAPELPVLLTSGFDLDAVRDGERQFSAKVVQKPYSQHDLALAVRAALAAAPQAERTSPENT